VTTLEIDDAQSAHSDRECALSLFAVMSLIYVRIRRIRNPKSEIRTSMVVRPTMDHRVRHALHKSRRISRSTPINYAANPTHKKFRISGSGFQISYDQTARSNTDKTLECGGPTSCFYYFRDLFEAP